MTDNKASKKRKENRLHLGIYAEPRHCVDASVVDTMNSMGFHSLRSYSHSQNLFFLSLLKNKPADLFAGIEVNVRNLLKSPGIEFKKKEIALLMDSEKIYGVTIGNEILDEKHMRNLDYRKEVYGSLTKLIHRYKKLSRNRIGRKGLSYGLRHNDVAEIFGRSKPPKELEALLDECDFVSLNTYRLNAWQGIQALDKNRAVLENDEFRHEIYEKFERHLRIFLDYCKKIGKKAVISEIGVASGVGLKAGRKTKLVHDRFGFKKDLQDCLAMCQRLKHDSPTMEAVYFFEWQDNPQHLRVLEDDFYVHATLGLKDEEGIFKFPQRSISSILR